MMTEQERVRELLNIALDNFDRPGTTVAALVRQAARIASLRHDYANQHLMQLELLDVAGRSAKALHPISTKLITLLGRDEAQTVVRKNVEQWQRNRRVASGNVNARSIAQIEQQLVELKRIYQDYEVPENLSAADSYHMAVEIDKQKATLVLLVQESSDIVERIRQSVHDFLLATETEINSGSAEGGVFERGLEYVRAQLAQRSPSALAKFKAAEDRLRDGSPEDLSQALTSVRRMIKELADVLYPATGETIVGHDKISRVMDDAAYRNRLIQFVKDKLGKSDLSGVVSDTLRSLGTRLTNLDRLANKGVHSDVGAAEAETTVVWTFLLAADLLRIDDGTSLDLAPDHS